MSDRLGVDAIAARFRRWAGPAAPPVPADPPSDPPAPPPDGPRGWLTAEAAMPPAQAGAPAPVTDQDPTLYSNTQGSASRASQRRAHAPGSPAPAASAHRPGPPGTPPPGRRPKRRRWATPTSPAERQAEAIDPPAPELHLCPFCHRRHQPVALGGGGLADVYSRTLVDDPYSTRPTPLGRDGHTVALVRDSFSPWRGTAAEVPPTPGTGTLRDFVVRLWQGDDPP